MYRIWIALSLFSLAFWSYAEAVESGIVVLTSPSQSDETPLEVQEYQRQDETRKAELRHREASRSAHLLALKRITDEMATQGCAVVDESLISQYDEVIADAVQFPGNHVTRLAFVKASFNTEEFKGAQELATRALYENDSGTHQTISVLEFPDLGYVIVEELSYRTITDSTIRVNRPTGNLTIRNRPATYIAVRNAEGTKGATGITFTTDEKHVSVIAMNCVTPKDKRLFNKLRGIANAVG